MSESGSLWFVSQGQISLREAAERTKVQSGVLVAYAPASFQLIALRDAEVSVFDAVRGIYEARIFLPGVELRWQRDFSDAGTGTAVFVAIDKGCCTALDWGSPDSLPYVGRIEGEYLLANGAGRIGYNEFLGAAPGDAGIDGNLVVVEHMLVAMERLA